MRWGCERGLEAERRKSETMYVLGRSMGLCVRVSKWISSEGECWCAMHVCLEEGAE